MKIGNITIELESGLSIDVLGPQSIKVVKREEKKLFRTFTVTALRLGQGVTPTELLYLGEDEKLAASFYDAARMSGSYQSVYSSRS